MKLQGCQRLVGGLIIGLSTLSSVEAASIDFIWGEVDSHAALLKNFKLVQQHSVPPGLHLPQEFMGQKNAKHSLQFIRGSVDSIQVSHARYDQYYRGLPVWGAQVIYHVAPRLVTTITGKLISGIDKEIKNLDGQLPLAEAKKIALGKLSAINPIHAEKIIYVDENKENQAVLAYFISYVAKTDSGPTMPHSIIDANSGEILLSWDGLEHAEVGQGPGGVTFNSLSYRPGQYQFGNLSVGVNALGKTNITVQGGNCVISNNLFRAINLENQTEDNLPFSLPVSYAEERTYGLNPFSYPCTAPDYLNANDNGFAPVNDGLSPINDVTYFIQQTYNLLVTQYGVASPVGTDLPIHVFTHISDYNNAFACSTTCMRNAGVIGPQTLVFGNGNSENAPYTDVGTSGHEFAHLVTSHFSALIYAQQSGGINEAFSDMTEFALKNHLRKTYPWLWNGLDWTVGLDISKIGKAERYMNNPPLDGHSIGNAANFVPGMDVHWSSGVFNKAFYLLVTSYGWTVDRAYEIMLDANMHFWIPSTNFNYAACGVIQSAYNRGYRYREVMSVFQQVGVTCLVGAVPGEFIIRRT